MNKIFNILYHVFQEIDTKTDLVSHFISHKYTDKLQDKSTAILPTLCQQPQVVVIILSVVYSDDICTSFTIIYFNKYGTIIALIKNDGIIYIWIGTSNQDQCNICTFCLRSKCCFLAFQQRINDVCSVGSLFIYHSSLQSLVYWCWEGLCWWHRRLQTG